MTEPYDYSTFTRAIGSLKTALDDAAEAIRMLKLGVSGYPSLPPVPRYKLLRALQHPGLHSRRVHFTLERTPWKHWPRPVHSYFPPEAQDEYEEWDIKPFDPGVRLGQRWREYVRRP